MISLNPIIYILGYQSSFLQDVHLFAWTQRTFLKSYNRYFQRQCCRPESTKILLSKSHVSKI